MPAPTESQAHPPENPQRAQRQRAGGDPRAEDEQSVGGAVQEAGHRHHRNMAQFGVHSS